MLAAYAAIANETQGHHGTGYAAFLHRDQNVEGARRRLHELIRDLIAEGVAAGELRNDTATDELATHCLHAIAAASALPSNAAVTRIVAVTVDGLRPRR